MDLFIKQLNKKTPAPNGRFGANEGVSRPTALIKIGIVIAFFHCAFTLNLHAAKAVAHPVEVTQPDGTSLFVRLKGDEFFHYKTTLDGDVIFRNEKGYYVYGVLDNSQLELAAVKRRERAALYEKNLQSFKSGMKTRALRANADLKQAHFMLVLVEFSDLSFQNTAADFDEMLNGVDAEYNYTYNGATGSLRKYYSDNSNGSFVPTVDVYGPVKVSKAYSYYGGNDKNGRDKAPTILIHEKILAKCFLIPVATISFINHTP